MPPFLISTGSGFGKRRVGNSTAGSVSSFTEDSDDDISATPLSARGIRDAGGVRTGGNESDDRIRDVDERDEDAR